VIARKKSQRPVKILWSIAIAAFAIFLPFARPLLAITPVPVETWQVVGIDVLGEKRTDPSWVESYLGFVFPATLTDADIAAVRAKLMTTDVFQRVSVSVRPSAKVGEFLLVVDLHEKWTTIPVIRGAYGGGTPLTVMGVYDTHSFGRLWTLGAESHKYGPSPHGFVVWAKAPRWLTGKHAVGVELWREFRRRSIYVPGDASGSREPRELGVINTNTWMGRVQFLAPLGESVGVGATNWQAGAEAEVRREAPVVFEQGDVAEDGAETAESPPGIRIAAERSTVTTLSLKGIYDNVRIEDQDMDGARVVLRSGPLIDDVGRSAHFEVQVFQFFLWSHHWNLALHGLVGGSNSNALQAQYFLGGFDSIRGLPDGAIYGTHAAYANVELRKLVGAWKYAKVQTAVFVDGGGAGTNWDDVESARRLTGGGGLRIAIPQVYRLMFRVDYAWSLDGRGGQGFSAGLNQFFQPYKPL